MLETYVYAPILRTRNAELKALLFLGDQAKKNIFPIISVSPLPNANHMSNTYKKVAEALEDRRFALDLDGTARGTANKRPAQSEFEELFDNESGYQAYYNLVQSIATAVPVLRLDKDRKNIDHQLAHIDEIDRGFFVRLEHGLGKTQIGLLETLLDSERAFIPIVDLGWAPDVVLRQVWAEGILNLIRAKAKEFPFEVVFAASSFPDTFTKMGAQKSIRIDERDMFDEVQAKFNTLELTYGDWASTRARQPPVPMTPVARIDLPQANEWVLFRSEDEEYSDIAERVMMSPKWDPKLKIWGTNVIEWTAASDPAGIRGPAAATAARINIHLHKQALFGTVGEASDGAEPFNDDF